MITDSVCFIVAAGDCYEEKIQLREQDFLVAVDGGYDTVKKMGLEPNLVLGDFDSVQSEPVAKECVRLKREKDETDTLYAVQLMVERGYQYMVIYGGTGGERISHTISNLQTLIAFSDLHLFLVDREEAMFLLIDGEIHFSKDCQGMLSVFSMSEESTGVSERHLKYQLEDAKLVHGYPIGVSNEFVGEESIVAVKNGMLLLCMEKSQLSNIKKWVSYEK